MHRRSTKDTVSSGFAGRIGAKMRYGERPTDRNRDTTPMCSLQNTSCKDTSILDERVFVPLCPSVLTRIGISDRFVPK